MESPLSLDSRPAMEVLDQNLYLENTSKLKTEPAGILNGSTNVLMECKAAYLGVKKTIGEDLLSSEELARALQQAGFNPSQQTIDKYWSNSTGSVPFANFCDFVESEFSQERIDPVSAFGKLDPNSCGIISIKELHRFMTTKGEKMSEDEFSKIFETSPFVKDGNFDYKSCQLHVCQMMTEVMEWSKH